MAIAVRLADFAESQEIAHGTATTDMQGWFAMQFSAHADPRADEKDEPAFEFAVSVNITDTTGETCSAQRKVDVGYTALRASLTAAEWLTEENPVEITIATRTLDGVPHRADGSLKIYRLKQPDQVHRPSLFDYPVALSYWTPGSYGPHERALDPNQPASWKPGNVAAQILIATNAAGHASYSTRLPSGAYLAKFETRDQFGKPVVSRLPLQILAPDAKNLAVTIPYLVAARQQAPEPGEEFMARLGKRLRSRAGLHRNRTSRQDSPGLLDCPRADSAGNQAAGHRGHARRVHLASHYGSREPGVPDLPENRCPLDEQESDHQVGALRLQAAAPQKETWTAVVSGPDAKSAVAEMVATLYDRSLDTYLPQVWQPGFGVFRQDWSKTHVQFENLVEVLPLRDEQRHYYWSKF